MKVQPKGSCDGLWDCALQEGGEPTVLYAVFQDRFQRVERGRCKYLQQSVTASHITNHLRWCYTHTWGVSKECLTYYTYIYLSSVYNSASFNDKIYASCPLKLNFDLDRGVFPMVIQAVVDEGDGRLLELGYSHVSFFYILRLAVQTEKAYSWNSCEVVVRNCCNTVNVCGWIVS